MSTVFNVFDFETTDTDPKTCGVIQGTMLMFGEVTGPTVVFNEVMNTQVVISEEASEVHGWTKKKLDKGGYRSEDIVMEELCEKVRFYSQYVMCGYNNDRFDNVIIRSRYDSLFDRKFDETVKTFDLMGWLLRNKTLDSYKLGNAYKSFFNDYAEDAAHEAEYDCLMVGKLIDLLVPDLDAAVAEMQEPAVISTMPFGKHAGKPFYKMPRRYMRYMLTLDINADVRLSMETELTKRPGR